MPLAIRSSLPRNRVSVGCTVILTTPLVNIDAEVSGFVLVLLLMIEDIEHDYEHEYD